MTVFVPKLKPLTIPHGKNGRWRDVVYPTGTITFKYGDWLGVSDQPHELLSYNDPNGDRYLSGAWWKDDFEGQIGKIPDRVFRVSGDVSRFDQHLVLIQDIGVGPCINIENSKAVSFIVLGPEGHMIDIPEHWCNDDARWSGTEYEYLARESSVNGHS